MAAAASGDLAFLAATARRSIDDLRAAIQAVPTASGRRGANFLAVVGAALDILERGIADREVEFSTAKDDAERRAVVRAMRRTNYDVMSLHEGTPWIESAQKPTISLGLVYLVDQMVKALLKAPADVVASPTSTYMYSTIHKPYESALANLGAAYPAAIPPVIVMYPVQEPDSLFLHLIIAHELGHSAATAHDLVDEVFRLDPSPTDTRNELSAAVIAYASAENTTPAVARAKVRAILRSWLTELICDGLALGFLGPAFLYTAAAFSTPFGGPEPSHTHPPFTLRTRLLLERTDAWGWRGIVDAATPLTVQWIAKAAAEPQLAGRQTYYLRLEETIERLSPTIEQAISAHLGSGRFLTKTYTSIADELSTLLEHRILPSQLLDQSPADCRSIVLAGWLYAFRKHGDGAAQLAAVVGDRDLQRFLSKALEMSVVLERWKTL